jgi:hypothetical protein
LLIFPVALATGIAVGYGFGGRLRHLAGLSFRLPGLLGLALLLQLGLGLAPKAWRFSLVLVSYAAVGVWLVVNARRRTVVQGLAIGLVAVGWLMNFAAIAANGGMPVSRSGLDAIGAQPGVAVDKGNLFKHVLVGPGTRGEWLGDVIPVRALHAVISVGDIVMGVGIVLTIAVTMVLAPDRGERGGPESRRAGGRTSR